MSVPPKKVSLKDELKADRRIEGCVPKLNVILNSMSSADRKQWVDVLADSEITTESIMRGLNKRGYAIGRQAIQTYRAGDNAHRVA